MNKGGQWANVQPKVAAKRERISILPGDVLGYEGCTICTLAFGEDVARIPPTIVGKLVDVNGLKHCIRQNGVLYWSEHTEVILQLEPHHLDYCIICPYNLADRLTGPHVPPFRKWISASSSSW